MNKVEFSCSLSQEQKNWKQKQYDALIKDPDIQNWLRTYQVNEQILYDNITKFLQWKDHTNLCKNCLGLAYCKQKVKGQYMDLYMNQVLEFGIHRCHYFKENQNLIKHGAYYLHHKLNQEQLKIDISQLDLSKESDDYKLNVMEISQLLMDSKPLKGLYLWGIPGVGKSFLAIGITNYYTKNKQRCAFINMPRFIGELKTLFYDTSEIKNIIQIVQSAKVLVLDDIGGESVSTWSRDDILLPLLDYRLQNQLLTFFTSNYKLDELKVRYMTTSNKISDPVVAERLLERIKALSKEEFVNGISRRK